ncbi:MAG: hypothetical protein HQ575_06875 [Candidatus Omnitrophica bacterium]|nr:hypothetical protein [Candidatus Omnitrophota bacterium]
MKDMILRLKRELTESVQRNKANGILFSGGLDTAVLASIMPDVKGFTVSLESYGEDLKYAASVARLFGIQHNKWCVDTKEAIESIPEVIKILKTFDPAIPNDLAAYFGLKLAKEHGVNKIMTGDGSDELFGGYSFMQEMDDLDGYIRKISQHMCFSSNIIAEAFGIEIIQPFMDKGVVDFALSLSADLKIRRENGIIRGKWILRKAFEDILPPEIAWQSKRPLEYGSGMTNLRDLISSRITDEELRRNSKDIKFISNEHYYYYKVYSETVGDIPKPKSNQKPCPNCGAGMDKDAFHCRVCGLVLDWRTATTV